MASLAAVFGTRKYDVWTSKRNVWDNSKEGTLLCYWLPKEKLAQPDISYRLSLGRYLIHICIVKRPNQPSGKTWADHYIQVANRTLWPASAPEAIWHHGLCTLWLQRSRTDGPPHPPGLTHLAETETPTMAAGWVHHQQAVGNGGWPPPHHPIPDNMWTEGLSTADRPQKKKKKHCQNRVKVSGLTQLEFEPPCLPRWGGRLIHRATEADELLGRGTTSRGQGKCGPIFSSSTFALDVITVRCPLPCGFQEIRCPLLFDS